MEQHGYRFGHTASLPPFLGTERPPFALLSYVNSGRCNGRNKTPKLFSKVPLHDDTLETILRNERDYAVERWAVTRDNFFELNIGEYCDEWQL
jgi:hypothetical protein